MSGETTALLLIEPDHATRQLYERELSKRWRVVAVEQITEMLDVLTAEPINAIILEPGAIKAEQWQLLTAAREQIGKAALPIIICSSVDERSKGYESGASAYLIKPVSPRQLSSEVARWLQAQLQAEESN